MEKAAELLRNKYAKMTIKRWDCDADLNEKCTYVDNALENAEYYADWDEYQAARYFHEFICDAEKVTDDEKQQVVAAVLAIQVRMSSDDAKWIVEWNGETLFEGTPEEADEKYHLEVL